MKTKQVIQLALGVILTGVVVIIVSLSTLSQSTPVTHPVPTTVQPDDISLLILPSTPETPTREDLKVPVSPALPWLPYGQRGILA